VSDWTLNGGVVSTEQQLSSDRTYRLATSSDNSLNGITFTTKRDADSSKITAHVRMHVSTSLVPDGNFEKGEWGPVGNCFDTQPATPGDITASIIKGVAPGGLPALQLSAELDSSCETVVLRSHTGSLLLSLLARSMNGATPSLCVWEQPSNTCALIPPITSSSKGWRHYGASFVPVSGTTSLTLFLYANAEASGQPAIIQYADVEATSISGAPNLDLIGIQGDVDELHGVGESEEGHDARAGERPNKWLPLSGGEMTIVTSNVMVIQRGVATPRCETRRRSSVSHAACPTWFAS
jgi:hypothetical protein